VKNSNGPQYFNNKGMIYGQALMNDTYNEFWKVRNIRTHLKDVKPAVLVVGGWFDAEDLFGALQTYKAIETQTPGNNNRLVMGPWTHGGWSAPKWNRYATYNFGQDVNLHYQRDIETPFFNTYLKGKGDFSLSEATVFETGSNEWKSFPQWPPAIARPNAFYFHGDGQLKTSAPTAPKASTSYSSEPAKPVPYTQAMGWNRNNDYLGEDQRFLAGRKDVLRFETPPLQKPMELLGPVQANLFVNSTGSDVDLIVKLIDIFPPSEIDPSISGLQQLVRAEVFRGKFRKSYSKPEAFTPGKTELVAFTLNDVAHVFKPGHRVMIQVQSSWFPLVDRNPQQFLSIPMAKDNDYRKAIITLQHNREWPSHIVLPIADH
jgi:putative CocE/NonD family hydrolase